MMIMIGIIRATGIDGQVYRINVSFVSLYTPSTPELCYSLSGNKNAYHEGATIIVAGGMPIQVLEDCEYLDGQLEVLRRENEDRALQLGKEFEKDSWPIPEEEEDWDDPAL